MTSNTAAYHRTYAFPEHLDYWWNHYNTNKILNTDAFLRSDGLIPEVLKLGRHPDSLWYAYSNDKMPKTMEESECPVIITNKIVKIFGKEETLSEDEFVLRYVRRRLYGNAMKWQFRLQDRALAWHFAGRLLQKSTMLGQSYLVSPPDFETRIWNISSFVPLYTFEGSPERAVKSFNMSAIDEEELISARRELTKEEMVSDKRKLNYHAKKLDTEAIEILRYCIRNDKYCIIDKRMVDIGQIPSIFIGEMIAVNISHLAKWHRVKLKLGEWGLGDIVRWRYYLMLLTHKGERSIVNTVRADDAEFILATFETPNGKVS